MMLVETYVKPLPAFATGSAFIRDLKKRHVQNVTMHIQHYRRHNETYWSPCDDHVLRGMEAVRKLGRLTEQLIVSFSRDMVFRADLDWAQEIDVVYDLSEDTVSFTLRRGG